MVPYMIGAIIFTYVGFIIYKRVKDIKEGKSCCDRCSSCPSKNSCSK